MLTRLGNKFRLPDVTAYLVAGVLIGPSLLGGLNILGLGFHSFEELGALGAISDIALGFIAFSIGNEFRLSQLRETGRQALIIGVLQAVVTELVRHGHTVRRHRREQIRVHHIGRNTGVQRPLHHIGVLFRRDHGHELKFRQFAEIHGVQNRLELRAVAGGKCCRSDHCFTLSCFADGFGI